MVTPDSAAALAYQDSSDEETPTALRVGLLSAVSVVGAIGIFALGLAAMVLVGWLAGLLILFGALPLWGWACVHNRIFYGN